MDQKWIYTSERFPVDQFEFLVAWVRGVWDVKPQISIGYWNGDQRNLEIIVAGGGTGRHIVAWMPLPEPPKPLNWGEGNEG